VTAFKHQRVAVPPGHGRPRRHLRGSRAHRAGAAAVLL